MESMRKRIIYLINFNLNLVLRYLKISLNKKTKEYSNLEDNTELTIRTEFFGRTDHLAGLWPHEMPGRGCGCNSQ